VFGLAHGRLEVIRTQIVSWLFNADDVKVDEFVPTGDPFFLHEYTAMPPFVAAAVNVTGVPWQTEFALAVILTSGISVGLTVIIIYALSAFREVQARLEIIFTQIVSWSMIELVVNVGELVPTAVPFFLHE
jgi:hypothetical protein